jgi:tetratricopeptide (TPR) repeat protein
MSTQEIIYEKIKAVYQDAVVKKINKDNYLDIHLPSVNDKKGTHLFFNTSKGKIKLGFYCREDDFVENMLKKSAILEKYSQGIRLKGNMEYDAPEDAVIAAVSMISAMTGSTANTAVKEPEKAPELVDQHKENDEERGFPMLRFRKPPEELKEAVSAYLKKWQKPSSIYNWRLGITAYIPEFVAELVSDDVCPVFTVEQINKICSKISDEKIIPILDYAPKDLYFHTKRVWWIVPFCIWKDDTATMLFVDKDGFYSIYVQDDDEEIRMIFSWEAVHELEFEYAVGEDDDPNVCRLTLYQENGAYLTFDEFISEGPEGDHGSYLKVIEAIWEARRETIEASRGEPFWLEGEGGETFEEYGHPSELYKSEEDIIAEKNREIRSLSDFEEFISFVKAQKGKIEIEIIYQGLSEDLKIDEDVCKALLDVNLAAFNFFSEEMKHNKIIQEYALSKDGYVFEIFPEEYKKDKQYIKSMLQECPADQNDRRGSMVAVAESPLNSDLELLNLAIEKNADIFQEFYSTDRYCKELFELFLKVTPRIYKHVPENLRDDKDLFISLLSGSYDAEMRVSIFKNSNWYHSPEFGIELINKSTNPDSYSYLKPELQNDDRLLAVLYNVASKQRYKPGGAFDPETSLKFVDQLLKYDKDKSRAYYLRARHIDEYRLSYDDCINALQSCLEINPSHVSALILIGSKSKDVSEAINFFEKALAVEPTNRSAYYNLGYKLTYAERYQEAVDNFNKALEIEPDDHTRANIGKCLLNLNQIDKAIAVLEEATTGTPYLDDAHYDLAKAYVKANRIDKATDAIDKAIKVYDKVDYYEFKLKIYRDYTNKAEQAEALQGLVDFLKATNGKRQEQIDYLGKLNSDKEFLFLSVYTRISDFLINHILENGTLSAMSQLILNPELKPEQKEKLEAIINDKSSNMEK